MVYRLNSNCMRRGTNPVLPFILFGLVISIILLDIDATKAAVLMHDLDLSRNGMNTLKKYWPGKFPNS